MFAKAARIEAERLAYHAASVAPRIPSFIAAVPIAVAIAAACTGAEPTISSSAPTPPASPLPTTDVEATIIEGEYVYENNGVKVTLSWHGGEGILTVDNGSGADLGEPGLYAVTPRQTQVSASLTPVGPVGNGQRASIDVAFPESITPADAGLIVLTFGEQNWGALSPKVIVAG